MRCFGVANDVLVRCHRLMAAICWLVATLTGCFLDHPLKWQLEFERESGTIMRFGLPFQTQNVGVPFGLLAEVKELQDVLHM